ncbi:MAG: hypothetical protein ACE364_08140 [Chlorobiota bacterium]
MKRYIVIIPLLLLVTSCMEDENPVQELDITFTNSDTIDKFIFLDSWIIFKEVDNHSSNSEFLSIFINNPFLNLVVASDTGFKYDFKENTSALGNPIKGKLNEFQMNLAIIEPKQKVVLRIKTNHLKETVDSTAKFYYQVATFKCQDLTNIGKYRIFKGDTIFIDVMEGATQTNISTSMLNENEIKNIFELNPGIVRDSTSLNPR